MELQLDKKKLLALIGLILVSCGIGYLLYTVFFKSESPTVSDTGVVEDTSVAGQLGTSAPAQSGGATNGSQSPTPTALPTAALVTPNGTSQVVAVAPVIQVPSAGVTLSKDGEGLQFYNKTDGKFYRTDADGKQVALSDETFPSVKAVEWAPDKQNAVIQFPDDSKVVYDFAAKKQYTIPKHWEDIHFSPDSKQITGKSESPDPNYRYLFTSDKDGTGAVPIEPLGENGDKVLVSWSPNNQVIAFSKTGESAGAAADRQNVLLIGKNHENIRQMTVEGLGFQPQWSPSGDRVLYSVHSVGSDLKPTLWIDGGSDSTVGAAKNFLNINTWASKCSFASNDEAVCAVPNPDKLTPGIGFAPWLATDTDDTIYKINIKTGFQTVIAKPDGNRTIEQVTVSKDGQYLFMKDQNTGEVLKMQLK